VRRFIKIRFGIIPAIIICWAFVAQAAPVVRDIQVLKKGGGGFDSGYVMAHTRVKAGEEFNSALVSGDVRRLLDTGRFSTVKAGVENMDAGVRVIYTVEPKLWLAEEPEISGNKKLSARKIKKILGLKKSDMVDNQTVAVAVNNVLDEYRKKSYPNVTCDWKIKAVEGRSDLAKVSLHFKEGKKNYITKIEVRGNHSLSSATLRKALEKPTPFNPFRWFFKKRYNKYELVPIAEQVKRVYLDHGFLDVKVSYDVAAKEKDDEKKIETGIITVEEGPLYRVGSVEVKGITKFPESAITRLITLDKGGIASLKAIEDNAKRIQTYYGDRGYLNSSVRYEIIPHASHIVDVVYTVSEGELVKIRNIIIRGNTRTRDKVIRQELLVYPGETYNQTRVERSKRRIKNLGFFSNVQVIPQKTNNPGRDDIIFDVAEKRTGQFMVGAGFSSVDHILGFVELTQSNFDLFGWPHFTGGGQKLQLRAQLGSTRKDYTISFTEPWLFDRKLSLGLNLYSRNRNYKDYDVETRGGSVSLSKSLFGPNRISVRYSLDSSRITDVADTNTYYKLDSYDFAADSGEPFAFDDGQDNTKSTLTFSLVHDTRNNPFVPSRGNKLQVFYSYSGGPLGFDTEMQDLGLKTFSYVPLWFGHVISLKTRFQFIEPMGDSEEIPLANKLFLGGGHTLRGFKYRDVGPKVIRKIDDGTYYARVYGGQSLFMASAEYTIPIVKGVRLAAFYDTGNVWEDTYKFDPGDLACSYGFGVRLDMPGFPIRIDRAFVIDKDDEYTEEDKWVIWIGYDN